MKVLMKTMCLAVVALLIVSVPVFAGGQEESTEAAAGQAYAGREAPDLAAQVETGELPPLEERLPEEPLVIEPFDSIGEYGGTIETFLDKNRPGWHVTAMSNDAIVRFDPAGADIIPNVAKDYEILDGGRTFVFHLRPGMKWSDGEPFTSEDIAFWWEDIVMNEDLNTSVPVLWRSGGEPAEFSVVDDYTVRFTFNQPRGFQMEQLTGSEGEIWAPKHYLTQFHPDYAEEADLEKMLDEANLDTWDQLFAQKNDYYINTNPDLPVLRAWVLETPPPANRYIAVRNPYYWKVDSAGKQLPYVDQIAMNVGVDQEVINHNIVTGSADIQYTQTSMVDFTLYKENETQGGYRVLRWKNDSGSDVGLLPNITHQEDPVLGQLLADKRFRQALSLAINREQINEMLYSGLGVPRQATLMEDSPFYKESYGRSYAAYDPDRAAALLDDLGLDWDKNREYRVRADGKTLSLLMETATGVSGAEDVFAVVKSNWEDIGIQADWRITDRNNFRNRVYSGAIQVGAWGINGALYPYRFSRWAPWRKNCYWGSLYGQWYESEGETGIEPTGAIERMLQYYDDINKTTDPAEKAELFEKIFDIHEENVYLIGTVGELPVPIIVNEDLKNVPETGIYSWKIGQFIGHKRPEQFYYGE